MHHAQQHSSSSNDSSLFSSALGMLSGNKHSYANEDIDEQSAVQAHQSLYGDTSSSGRQHNSETMGAGAAMQALKMFTGGGGQQQEQHHQGGGGGSQNAFIGMAMGQASKLFDQQSQQGNVDPRADKQSVVNDAAKMAFKMYMKSQMQGGG
ncbi:MAG: hypothetical protein Q9225_007139, partial [Loekoesia sp. 1 TL-2023]